jgi:hypothetical protein
MSSTNRSNARDEHVADYYITPIPEIEKFLGEFEKVYGYQLHHGRILDPCAGGDVNHDMSYPVTLQRYNSKIDTIDIRTDSRAATIGDYLQMDCSDRYDLIITNPPFNIALPIITKALEDVKRGGVVVMLLRLNFFGSKDRKPFWDEHMPEYCFVHHRRMSFIEKGGTDSIEYCHMVWRKGYNPEHTLTKII